MKVGKTTYRFNQSTHEYEIRHPGNPTAYAHFDPLSPNSFEGGTEEAAVSGGSVTLPTSTLAPICRPSGNRVIPVYTHRSSDETPTPTSTIRNYVERMNWKINDQSSQSSGGARAVKMVVDCSEAGKINVYDVVTSASDLTTVKEAVKQQVAGEPTGGDAVKYLIFDHEGASGIATVYNDATKSSNNNNAAKTGYAVTYYNSWDRHTTVHELFHTMGASQGFLSPKAPYSTSKHHCTDGLDVLCYADESKEGESYSETRCPASSGYETPVNVPIDCGNDTYFDAAPEQESWLDIHWNVAGYENPFLIVPGPPSATTGGQSLVGNKSATLSGTVNPGGYETNYYFEYGVSEAYGSTVPNPSKSAGFNVREVPVSTSVGGLTPNTQYHYRLVASSAAGTAYGKDKSFTSGSAPEVVSGEASDLVGGSGVLHGEVNPYGHATTYYFEYGLTESYGKSSPVPAGSAGEGVDYAAVEEEVTDLQSETTYHYRLVAESGEGKATGEDKTVVTPNWRPQVDTGGEGGAVTDRGAEEATLHGNVNPNGSSTSYVFEYGTSTEYGQSIPVSPENIGSGEEEIEVSEKVEELEPETAYHFRLKASNSFGDSYSGDKTFTTLPLPPNYENSFGSQGSGNGQLKSPADAAVDSEGNLWVVDKGNDRVQRFNAAGEYLGQFGSQGSGNGQFEGPCSIAVDSADDVWVGDCGNQRIEKFNSAGEYQGQFGSYGSGNGQFSTWGPKGIAIDANDNLWVSDYSSRIQKFNQAGEFVKSVGSYGSGDGQFKESAGIDVGLGGKVWVSDWINHRVSVFDESGEFLFKFGSEGSDDGQFKHPDGVEVDGKGSVWVLDEGNSRVQQFDEAGEFRSEFGSGGSGEEQFDFAWPAGLTSDDKGNLWIADSDNDRIQRWLIPRYVPNYHISFGSSGTGDGQFGAPTDVAADTEGNLWVTDDAAADRVQKFNPQGEFLFKFGSSGNGNGQFNGARAIAIDSGGNLLVVDRNNHRVQKFSAAGEYLSQFGSYGSEDGQFDHPNDIAIDEEGNIWVCDGYNERVQEFNEAGEFLQVIAPISEGHLYGCEGIDIGPDGKVWVAVRNSHDIIVFNKAGEFLFDIDKSGNGPGELKGPVAVEVDDDGSVWVAEQYNDRVQRFNRYGEYVTGVGSFGTGEEQFNFYNPYFGITIDQDGNIWITDDGNHRVQKWSFDPKPPPPPIATTEAATDVGGVSATLHGSVNPNEAATTYQFEYGATTAYGSTAPATPGEVGSGAKAVEVEAPVEGLESGTEYHARVVATNEGGTTYGEDITFTTLSPPTVIAKAAAGLSEEGATLKAVVRPNGAATEVHFEYGTTTEYGEEAFASPEEVDAEVEEVKVRSRLEGLEPGATYHFRLVATSEIGTTEGPDREFTLPEELPWEENHFEADSYPVILSADATHGFTFPWAVYAESEQCEQPDFATEMGSITTELAFDLEYLECTSLYELPVLVDANSCQYLLSLNSSGPPTDGTFDVACEEEGDSIEIDVYWEEFLICGVELPPQQGLEAVSFTNTYGASAMSIETQLQVEGLEYNLSGYFCEGAGYEDGGLTVETTLEGASEEEEPVGVYAVEG